MRKDYHMHPNVLKTPERFDLFVQKALEMNIQEICITDHMPLSISNAGDRISAGCVSRYCRYVGALAQKYDGVIRIKCGIEIDFFPSVTDEINQVLEAGTFDYILASSHMHVFVKDYENYTFNDFARAAIENSIRAVEFGRFHAISHLDMYRFAFENPKRFPLVQDNYAPLYHEVWIKELLDVLAAHGMYLEINPHLAEGKKDISFTYPEAPIVGWALDRNVRFSYGSDAHRPDSVGAYIDELESHPVYGKALAGWENGK